MNLQKKKKKGEYTKQATEGRQKGMYSVLNALFS